MENRIKECQGDLFADRTPAATMRANQLRLWFASMAYVLLCALRRIGLAGSKLASATEKSGDDPGADRFLRVELRDVAAVKTRVTRLNLDRRSSSLLQARLAQVVSKCSRSAKARNRGRGFADDAGGAMGK